MSKGNKAPTHGPEYEEFGRNLASARTARGLSQAEIAKSLGMIQSTYAGYETGTRKVPLSVIIQLANYFGKSADELISGKTPDMYPAKNNFSISDLEKDIIRKFRTLNDAERAMFLRTIGVEDIEKEDDAKLA